MTNNLSVQALRLTALAVAITSSLLTINAEANTVTDWNKYTVWATERATSSTF